MTSPHPQREEAARLWPEYPPKPRSFLDAPLLVLVLTMYGALSLAIDFAKAIWVLTR